MRNYRDADDPEDFYDYIGQYRQRERVRRTLRWILFGASFVVGGLFGILFLLALSVSAAEPTANPSPDPNATPIPSECDLYPGWAPGDEAGPDIIVECPEIGPDGPIPSGGPEVRIPEGSGPAQSGGVTIPLLPLPSFRPEVTPPATDTDR